jgi:hypothetical protein
VTSDQVLVAWGDVASDVPPDLTGGTEGGRRRRNRQLLGTDSEPYTSIAQLACGGHHSMALLQPGGVLRTWGAINVIPPSMVVGVTQIAAGWNFSVAVSSAASATLVWAGYQAPGSASSSSDGLQVLSSGALPEGMRVLAGYSAVVAMLGNVPAAPALALPPSVAFQPLPTAPPLPPLGVFHSTSLAPSPSPPQSSSTRYPPALQPIPGGTCCDSMPGVCLRLCFNQDAVLLLCLMRTDDAALRRARYPVCTHVLGKG